MKTNDLRCSLTLLIDVIKSNNWSTSSNLKRYEIEVAACLAQSMIEIREKKGMPFQAPFFSIPVVDSLTDKEMRTTGNSAVEYIKLVNKHFKEKGIDFSIGFSDRDFLNFQFKHADSISEAINRLKNEDEVTYAGKDMVIGYYLDELAPENSILFNTEVNLRDVIICGFNKNRDIFTWFSTKDVPITTTIPPWL